MDSQRERLSPFQLEKPKNTYSFQLKVSTVMSSGWWCHVSGDKFGYGWCIAMMMNTDDINNNG